MDWKTSQREDQQALWMKFRKQRRKKHQDNARWAEKDLLTVREMSCHEKENLLVMLKLKCLSDIQIKRSAGREIEV